MIRNEAGGTSLAAEELAGGAAKAALPQCSPPEEPC